MARTSDMPGRWTVARQVGQFTLAGLVALLVVAVATAVASQRVGQREATKDARNITLLKARVLVEPVLTDGLKRGEPAAVAAVDRVVRSGVLDDELVRVKIWTRDGRIVYSDEERLAGTRYALAEDDAEALDAGTIDAEISDLSRPENAYERDQGKLLEVYLPIRTPDGERLLFEAYFRYDAVSSAGRDLWLSFAPIGLGALVALQVVQIPLAWSLARRLRERQREREALLQRTIDASDHERRRIASDLHDGVVQDLAGVAYSLAGSARREGLDGPTVQLLDGSAAAVRESIKALRTLLVDIYPPNLAEAGLDAALTDLMAGVAARGTATVCDIEELDPRLPDRTAALVYRAAQEALRNVVAHAGARTVRLRAASGDGRVLLDVEDDGIGFDPALARTRAQEGHLGLRGLSDRVAEAGGLVTVRAGRDGGTHVHVEVPAS